MAIKKKEVVKQKIKVQNQSAHSNRFYLVLLFIFTFLVYCNTLQNDYALDDGIVITKNQFVQKGVAGIAEIFTHDSFYGWLKGANNDVAGGRYRPLSLVSFAIEHSMFGNNPSASHFINILLFALLGMAIFTFLKRLLIDQPTKYSYLTHLPFITALLFIVHPIHTEAVANIKGRDEILSMLFSVISITQFLKYSDEKRNNKTLFLASFYLLLAMLSKENAITFFLIIPIATWFFRSITFKKFAPVMCAIVTATLIFLLLRQLFANASINIEITELMNNPFYGMTMMQKYATIIFTFGKYLLLLVLPITLTNDYYPYQISIHSFTSIETIASLVICLVVLSIAIINIQRKTMSSFAILYFVITFSIVSNLFFTVGTFMSERFLFMPSLAYCLLLAYGISLLPFYKINSFSFIKLPLSSKIMEGFFLKKRSIQIILLFIVGSYSARTFIRNFDWENNLTLFSADLYNSPNSANSHHAIATEYRKAGEKSNYKIKQIDYYKKAISEDKKAVEIHPNFAQAYYNIGVVFLQMEIVDSAKIAFRKAIFIAPKYADALNNLGYCFIQENKLDSAIMLCNIASKIDTNYFRPYSNLGAAYLKKMDIEKGHYFFQKAHNLEPNDIPTTKAFEEISAILQNPN